MIRDSIDTQLEALRDILHEMGSVVTAFSGGVDSALVSVAAHEVLGDNALAVTAVSPALAARELTEAEGLARQFGFAHRVIRTNEMEREGLYRQLAPPLLFLQDRAVYSPDRSGPRGKLRLGSPTGPTPTTKATIAPVWKLPPNTRPAAPCWRPGWTRRPSAPSPSG